MSLGSPGWADRCMPTLECLHTLPVTRSPGTIVALHCQDNVASTTQNHSQKGSQLCDLSADHGRSLCWRRLIYSGQPGSGEGQLLSQSGSVQQHACSLPWPRWGASGGCQIAAVDYLNCGMMSRRFRQRSRPHGWVRRVYQGRPRRGFRPCAREKEAVGDLLVAMSTVEKRDDFDLPRVRLAGFVRVDGRGPLGIPRAPSSRKRRLTAAAPGWAPSCSNAASAMCSAVWSVPSARARAAS